MRSTTRLTKLTPEKPKDKGFPLIRFILLLAIVLGIAYAINQYINNDKVIADEKLSAKSKKTLISDSAKVISKAKASDYKVFHLENGQKQISIILDLANDNLDNLDQLDDEAKYIANVSLLINSHQSEKIVLDFIYTVVDSSFNRLDSFREVIGERAKFYYKRITAISPNIVLRNSKSKRQRKVWIDNEGCIWNNPCPNSPLAGAAIALDSTFNYKGREKLLYSDAFTGLGESPVKMILDGEVIDFGLDSASGSFVKFYNRHNIYTSYSGLGILIESIDIGDSFKKGDIIGRLSSKDSSSFYLQTLRNGRLIRYNDFYKETHPIK